MHCRLEVLPPSRVSCCEEGLTKSYRLLFFFNYTATTEIFSLSLHDALPICKLHLDGGISCLNHIVETSENALTWDTYPFI